MNSSFRAHEQGHLKGRDAMRVVARLRAGAGRRSIEAEVIHRLPGVSG